MSMYKIVFFLMFCLYSLPSLSIESVVLEKTRVIYNEGEKRTDVGMENKSSRNSYLVQTWIEDDAHHIAKEFIATPPLHVSRPGMLKSVEIWMVNNNLPSDRESLYYLYEKAIPSLDKKTEHKGLSVATGNRIKLIFRPSNLKSNVNDAPGTLFFKRNGHDILVQNPSPYYITAIKVNLSGVNLEDFMIAPKSTASIKNKLKAKGDKIVYNIIDDSGFENGPYRKNIF